MFRRGKIWWESVNGVRKSSGTSDKKDAEAYFARLRQRAWEEDRMGAKPPRSWQEAVVRYLKECANQPSYDYKRLVLRGWGELLHLPKDIRSITRDRVDQILDPTPLPSSANATLNRKVGVLHHMLAKACEEWDWIERKPRFRHYPELEAREKWLTPSQARDFLSLLSGDLLDFCTLALATGQRSGKLENLTWAQYDPAKAILTLSGAGNKRANPIPLNRTATAVLEARRTAKTRHMTRVFTYSCPPIKKHWVWWRNHIKPRFPGVTIHTLRHTFNSLLGQAGVSREVRMYLMGHSVRDVHSVYTHWSEESLRPAVEVIDRLLSENSHECERKYSEGA